jgi:hypothetical protein
MSTQAKNWEVYHIASDLVVIRFVSKAQAERYGAAMPGCRARMMMRRRTPAVGALALEG